MSAPFRYGYDPTAHEREIQSLSGSSGASLKEVRALFVPEFARLEMGAKVGSYLTVLTESNVRGMLRRATRPATTIAAPSPSAQVRHDG